jgi:hypothetical protein
MLAPNYMTPTELRISDQLHAALIKVLGMFERGEMQYAEYQDGFMQDIKTGFNLAIGLAETQCGTVGCYAGWASIIMRVPFTNVLADLSTQGLANLFYGNYGKQEDDKFPVPLSKVNIEEAKHALRNYLITGDPRWNEVLA